ncbi:Acetyltransferase (GNAT) family protein [compost metagenome]
MVSRLLTTQEIRRASQLHFEAFSGFFLTSLGKSFLRAFYKGILEHPDGIAVGVFDNGHLVAFAVGTKCKNGFYSDILRKKVISMSLAAMPKLISSPSKVLRLFNSLKSSKRFGKDIMDNASLLSICVCPRERGKGLGAKVLKAFEEIAFRDSDAISLTTDFMDNDYVNNFYQTNQYELYDVFLQDQRKMNLYLKKRRN